MDLTVLISTWNNSRLLEITLNAFKDCIIPSGLSWQIVLVNNNCTDNTDEVVSRFAGVLPILYVKEPIQGLSRARNTGLKAASGEWVIFTDDDVKPCRDWLQLYWEAFNKNPTKYFFGGPIVSDFEGEKPDDALLSMAPCSVKGLSFGSQKRILLDSEDFISANWGASLEVIREAGGFDSNKGLNPASKKLSTGEETDLMNKLRSMGYLALYLPDALILHHVPKEKCSLKHIVARCEVGAFDNHRKYKYPLKTLVLLDKPVGLYIQIFIYFLKYVIKRLMFQNGIGQYIRLCILISVTKGFENELQMGYVKK